MRFMSGGGASARRRGPPPDRGPRSRTFSYGIRPGHQSRTSSGWDFCPMRTERQSDRCRPILGCARTSERRRPGLLVRLLAPENRARGRAERRSELRYDGYCRDRALGPGPNRGIRLRLEEGAEVVRRCAARSDPAGAGATSAAICWCATAVGNWTYQFAVTVDDLVDNVTLVIRGRGSAGSRPDVRFGSRACWAGSSRLCSCTTRSCAERTARS